MTDTRPSPLTPADCDLRGYDFMPLFGHRLFGSEFYARASDAEFRAAIRLWWAAWQQCPAGSLPSDTAALALLADYGRDVKGFSKVRESALSGFVLCSDGRLYHPLLCLEAKAAYERRRKERERKAAFRARDRAGQTAIPGGDDPPTSAGCPAGQDAGRDAESEGTGQDRTGQDRTGQNLREEDPPTPRKRGAATEPSAKSISVSLPTWLPAPAWADWCAHRERLGKKGWTQKAAELSISQLGKFRAAGDDPRAVIEQSIAAGWTGLFGLKNRGVTAPAKPDRWAAARAIGEAMGYGDEPEPRFDIDGTSERLQ